MNKSFLNTVITFSVVMALTLVVSGAPVLAEPHGHSDVEFSYSNDMIDIEFGSEGQVFEGDMPATGPLTGFTNEPGFGSETLEGLGIGPSDLISYNVLGPLVYHDGAGFVPTTATIAGDDQPDAGVVVISADTTGADGLGGLIGQADSIGDFHVDLGWDLSDGASAGAYGVLLNLDTDASDIANSDPFFIVFNFGLEEGPFEGAVEQFAAVVPEPISLAVVGVGGLLLLTRRRRQQA